MKSKNIKHNLIVVFLFLVMVVTSVSTFAYWSSNVEGTTREVNSTITVGSAQSVDTRFDLTGESISAGVLVPTEQLLNSPAGSTDFVMISHQIAWAEDNNQNQLGGEEVVSPVDIGISLQIYKDGVFIPLTSSVYELISVTPHSSNPSELLLGGVAETFSYEVNMSEPTNQTEYDQIANSSIMVIISYQVHDKDININNVPQSQPTETSGVEGTSGVEEVVETSGSVETSGVEEVVETSGVTETSGVEEVVETSGTVETSGVEEVVETSGVTETSGVEEVAKTADTTKTSGLDETSGVEEVANTVEFDSVEMKNSFHSMIVDYEQASKEKDITVDEVNQIRNDGVEFYNASIAELNELRNNPDITQEQLEELETVQTHYDNNMDTFYKAIESSLNKAK